MNILDLAYTVSPQQLDFIGSSNLKNIIFILFVALLLTCRPLVTTFNDSESAIYYTSSNQTTAIFHDSLKVMTWNIRFGAGRIPWFEDSCGDRVLMTETEIINILQNISLFIDSPVYSRAAKVVRITS